jgi:hypothetical protein
VIDSPYDDDPYDNPAYRNPNGSFNWQAAGLTNTGFNATNYNVNPNTIPGQNINPYSDPTNPAPNFNGNVTVDTASMSAFGQWVSGEVTEALKALKVPLQAVKVEPGAFYWADYVRAYINGTSPTTGLAYQLRTVIDELLDGLAGISSGVTQLVKLYANTEDLNSAQAANLQSDMSNSFANAYSYFNTVGTDSQSPNIAPQS